VRPNRLNAVSRIETEDAAPGVRSSPSTGPRWRNAFDTPMYQELTAALRDADADEAVGAVVLTGRGAPSPRARTWPRWPPSRRVPPSRGRAGFHGPPRHAHRDVGPLLAAVNGVAVGLGFTLLAHCDLVLVDAGARLRVPFAELGVPAEAASSLLFPPPWLAAGGADPAHLGLGTGRGAGRPRPGLAGLPAGTRSTRRWPAARVAAHPAPPPAPSRRSCGRPPQRRGGGQPPRAGAFGSLLGAAVGAGPWPSSRPGSRKRPDHAPGHHRRPDRPRATPAALAVAVEELGFDSLYLPSTRTCRARGRPAALVEGVRLDDYKRSLDRSSRSPPPPR